ncbi:MAG TPA: tricarballylate dehydrogenase, partial [Rhodospirillaceae bacterium]|nr:tricarballylate dehydrogenase [Rhodospirillaceae bacterium]
MADKIYDVIVVGGGNAALCAAMAAHENGAEVLILEKAPEEKRGGNSNFTGGGFRAVHHGAQDIKAMVPDLTDEEIAKSDFGEYPRERYLDDLFNVTQFYIDPDLAEYIVDNSTDSVHWLRSKGVRFLANYGRQAFLHEGRFKFFGGVVLYVNGGGLGLIESEYEFANKNNIEIRYETAAKSLIEGPSGVEGVVVRHNRVDEEIRGKAVVLASGGFQANREMRTKYLGPGFDSAKVRGTRYNTGDGINMALDIGAQSYGQWSGCHAVSWERY